VTQRYVLRAHEYLEAIEDGATGERLAAFYTANAVQEEFPNRLSPNGVRRGLAEILEGAARGQAVMRRQRFVVHNVIASGHQVVLEVTWAGTVAIPIGTVPPGGEMRARFCVVLEFEGDRIRRQRNYDCFDPF